MSTKPSQASSTSQQSERRLVMFVGDLHADDRTPATRKDDYLTACVEELTEILTKARRFGCDAIVMLGDIFHRMEPQGQCRNLILRTFLSFSDLRIITVVGNHDVKHNLQNLPNSALGTLLDAGVLVSLEECPDLRIGLGHFRAKIEDEIKDGLLAQKSVLIWALHASVATMPQFGEFILFDDVPLHPQTRLVVAGHIHHPMFQQREDGAIFINPGSICRNALNVENKERQPQVLVVDYALDGTYMRQKLIPLESSRPAAEIFRIEEVQARKDEIADTQNYIQQISQVTLWAQGGDKYEDLRRSGGLKGVDTTIIDKAIDALRAAQDDTGDTK